MLSVKNGDFMDLDAGAMSANVTNVSKVSSFVDWVYLTGSLKPCFVIFRSPFVRHFPSFVSCLIVICQS